MSVCLLFKLKALFLVLVLNADMDGEHLVHERMVHPLSFASNVASVVFNSRPNLVSHRG